MNIQLVLGIFLVITLASTVGTTILVQQQQVWAAKLIDPDGDHRKAPPAISGENVYVAWWTNNTADGNEEIMFRASTDGGATFGDKINLSNTTNADSWKAKIDSDGDSVVVTWWETNQTSDTPVMRVSTDNGETFGPLIMLETNGTNTTGEVE
jgi:hypothetical protein